MQTLVQKRKEIEGTAQQPEISLEEEKKKKAPAAKRSPEQATASDSVIQISISTPERKDIEGDEQQPEITPKEPRKRKRVAPAAKKEEVSEKSFC